MKINIIAGRSAPQELLFHFRSVLLCYRWNYMKAISLPDSLCGLCERWDSGIKPTCFASSQQVCGAGVCFLCTHTCMRVYLYVLVDIRAGMSVKLTSATGSSVDYLPLERWRGHLHISHLQGVYLVDNRISCLVSVCDPPHSLYQGFVCLDFCFIYIYICIFLDCTFFFSTSLLHLWCIVFKLPPLIRQLVSF